MPPPIRVLVSETPNDGYIDAKLKGFETPDLVTIVVLRPIDARAPVGAKEATQIGRIDRLGCKFQIGKGGRLDP